MLRLLFQDQKRPRFFRQKLLKQQSMCGKSFLKMLNPTVAAMFILTQYNGAVLQVDNFFKAPLNKQIWDWVQYGSDKIKTR